MPYTFIVQILQIFYFFAGGDNPGAAHHGKTAKEQTVAFEFFFDFRVVADVCDWLRLLSSIRPNEWTFGQLCKRK